MFVRQFFCVGLILLAGCSTPFVSSQSPDAASLRLRNSTSDVHLAGFAFENSNNCSGNLTLPYPSGGRTMPPGTELQLKIEPNQKFAIALGTSRIVSSNVVQTCSLIVSFRPQPRQRYLMSFQWPSDECSVAVSRLESIAGQDVPVPEPTAEKRIPSTGKVYVAESCQQ